jgi:mono/diheme cytochrome c family protein
LRKLFIAAVVLGAIGMAVFWVLTMPRTFSTADLPDHRPDLANGERMFWAGGCESCHAAPGAKGDELPLLVGGVALKTPFGTFLAPNISPDHEDGIGGWSLIDFVNAMKWGVGPDGRHLYPAFPYTSYQRMKIGDIIDLKAFLDTLPPVEGASRPHELPFPFSVRRGLGLWKMFYVDGQTLAPDPVRDDEVNLGAYLVEGPGHCAECHTPRNLIGALDTTRWLAGGPAPEGDGKVPNITPHPEALGSWSLDDIVFMFSHGITPPPPDEFLPGVVGGAMAAVQRNLARLAPADQRAMARYLQIVSAVAP